MKIDILTLFPEMFDGFKNESIIKRAIESKKVKINTCNFRDFSKDKHNKVDDTPYGGGKGMVLMCQPIFDAVDSLKKKNSKVILLSPQGRKYNQKIAYDLSKEKHLILICGHYEGFDERIKTIIDDEISIGDYVLTGGEVPAMVLADSVTRLIPGVIEEESHINDSFNNNLLDYPTYTKPKNYKGLKVPDVLTSGDHKKIEEYRKQKQLEITKEKRPDLLLKKVSLEDEDIKVKKKSKDKKEKKKKVSKKGYNIIKEKDAKAITLFEPDKLEGFKLKGRASKSKIVVVNPKLCKNIAYKNIAKKIDILKYRFGYVLNEDNDEDTSKVLGEAEMLKQMVVALYSKYLNGNELGKVLKDIDKLVREFVKYKTMNMNYVRQEVTRRGIR